MRNTERKDMYGYCERDGKRVFNGEHFRWDGRCFDFVECASLY